MRCGTVVNWSRREKWLPKERGLGVWGRKENEVSQGDLAEKKGKDIVGAEKQFAGDFCAGG